MNTLTFQSKILACAVTACVLTPAAVAAQPAAPPSGRPSLTAVRVQDAPVVDGEVLTDPAWQTAVPVSRFQQEQPDEGQPASERTEVRVVFTSDTLYLGVICFDRDPQSIVVSDARRDAPLDQTDSVQVILDTYRDRLNGFVFGHQPGGH